MSYMSLTNVYFFNTSDDVCKSINQFAALRKFGRTVSIKWRRIASDQSSRVSCATASISDLAKQPKNMSDINT